MAQGSGGYGNVAQFAQVENQLRNIAVQFASIMQIQQQIMASVQAWRMLQRELTLANAAAGGTVTQFKQMEQAARSFALASTFSASQVANAFYNLASAGLTVQQTLQAATGVILLAQATLADLGEASDTVSSTLSQFNLQAAESYRISNLFVAATNQSLATLPKLAFALRQVGPIAAQANLSLEETVGLLDQLFNAGLRGEQAGTALRNALVRVMNPVGEGGKILRALGVETIDAATGRARDFLEVMQEIADLKLGNDAIVQIFGVEAAAGASAILRSVTRDTRDASTALERHLRIISNTDDAYRQSVMQMNTLDGAITRAANNFNELRITIGQALAPVIIQLSETFAQFVSALKELNTEQLLAYANNALMIGGFLIVMRISTGVIRGIVGIAAAMRSVAIAARGIQAATTALGVFAGRAALVGRVLTMFTGVGGVILGLTGIAAAIWGIDRAMNAVERSRQRARGQNVAGGILDAYGRQQGLAPDTRQNFRQLQDTSRAYSQSVRDLLNQFQVNPAEDGGGGSFQFLRAANDRIRTGRAEIARLNAQIQALGSDVNTTRQIWSNAGEALREAFSTFREGETFEASRVLSTDMTGEQRLNYVRDIAAFLQRAASLEGEQLKNALIDYSQERINAIQLAGGNPGVRDRNLERQRRFRDLVEGLNANKPQDAEALRRIAQSLAAPGRQLAEQLEDQTSLSADDANSRINSAFQNIGEQAEANLVMTEQEYVNLLQELQRRQQGIRQTMLALAQRVGGIDPQLSAEITQFVITAGGLSREQEQALRRWLASPQGVQALQRITTEVKAGNLDLREAATNLANSAVESRVIVSTQLNQIVTRMRAIPYLNRRAIEDEIRRNEVELRRVRRDIIELTNPQQARELSEGILRDERILQQSDVVQDFLQSFAEGENEAARVALQNFENSPNRVSNYERIRQLLERRAAGDRAAAQELQTWLTRDYFQSVTGIAENIERFALRLQLANERNDLELARLNNDEQRRRERSDRLDQLLREILGLPSSEELYLQVQEMRLEARRRMTDYYEMPLQQIEADIERARIDYRQRLQEVQERFRSAFVDTLAQDIDAQNDPELADAFSGRLLQQIRQTGVGTFRGARFTREMLETQDGINRFIQSVLDAFAQTADGSVAAQARVEAAGRLLRAMTEQMGAEYDVFMSAMDELEARQREARVRIGDMLDDLKLQDIQQQFTDAIRLTAGRRAEELEITIDVAVRARISRILVDSLDFQRQLRERYMETIRGLGVAVEVGPDGLLRSVDITRNASQSASRTPTARVTSGNSLQTSVTAPAGGPTGSTNLPSNLLQFFTSNGIPVPVARGIVAGIVAEGGTDPNVRGGYRGRAVGHGQWLGPRRAELFRRYGQNPTSQQQLEFMLHELRGGDPGGRSVLSATNEVEALNRYIVNFMRPAPGPQTTGDLDRGMRALGYAGGGRTLTPDERERLALSQGQRPVVPIPEADLEASKRAQELAQRIIEEGNQRIEQARRVADARIRFEDDIANRTILSQQQVSEEVDALWEETFGRRSQALIDMATREKENMEALALAAREALVRGGNVADGISGLNTAAVAQRRAEIEVQRQERIAAIQRRINRQVAEQQIIINQNQSILRETNSTEEERADAQGEIEDAQTRINDLRRTEVSLVSQLNDALDDQASRAGTTVEEIRARLNEAAEALQERANRQGPYGDDMMGGMRAAVLQFAAEVPTVFETMQETALTFMRGLSDATVSLLQGNVQNAKQAVAQMLAAMGQLLLKMIVMYTMIQLIRAIPGGAAVLSALDLASGAGAGLGGGVKGFEKGGVGSFTDIKRPVDWIGQAGRIKYFADGGVQLSRLQRMMGGIRSPRSPAISVFGEGDRAEAYIPLLDNRTVPVEIGEDGQAYVPLPSGQRIPVSMKNVIREHARGGFENVFKWNTGAASRADAVGMGGQDAFAKYRQAGGAGNVTQANTYSIKFGDINYSGNAGPEDVEAMFQDLSKKMFAALDERDAENARKRVLRGMTLQGAE